MNRIACVFGGTGFIGRQVVRELCKAGYRVKIAARVPESAFEEKVSGSVGQVVAVPCDYSAAQIAAAIKGCDTVINLVGILAEKKKNGFEKIHADLPQMIAQSCAQQGVVRFVHISALGIDRNQSKYARSKKHGEEMIRRVFPAATILRPSIVFGPRDSFFNRFAKLAKVMPALPLIGGKTKFQPVFVGDIADAILAVVNNDAHQGKTFELGGPEVLTFKALYQRMFAYTHQPRCLLPIPFALAKIQGAMLSLLPGPLLTADQVESLKVDNVVLPGALTFKDLGLKPVALDAILPTYLQQYRPGGRFADKKTA